MDRTNEFQSMIGSRSTHGTKTGLDSRTHTTQDLAARTSFNTDAARIGQEIHIAQLKLDEVGKCMSPSCACAIFLCSGSSAQHFQRFFGPHCELD